jgi:hypothetical protein
MWQIFFIMMTLLFSFKVFKPVSFIQSLNLGISIFSLYVLCYILDFGSGGVLFTYVFYNTSNAISTIIYIKIYKPLPSDFHFKIPDF